MFRSYGKDGGGPTEVGCQKQASNHLKRLPLRVVVVSVEEKQRINSAGVDKEDEYHEPLLTCRNIGFSSIKTGKNPYSRISL